MRDDARGVTDASGVTLLLRVPATFSKRAAGTDGAVSTSVFQAPHAGHWPCHFGAWPPHSVHA
jgi:hypothetical protein